MLSPQQPAAKLRVVLFSGGRGSGALTSQLVTNPRIALTIAINGYDDGASTGEVRRFLGDSLGPSDFRKNASRVARLLHSAPEPLIDLLDARLAAGVGEHSVGPRLIAAIEARQSAEPALATIAAQSASLATPTRHAVVARVNRFLEELARTGASFNYADCSLGNLVFAGGFLLAARDFNRAVDDYCGLLGIAPGLIENVTDGTNAFLVALDAGGRLLGSEEEIVDAKQRNRIDDIYLLDHRLDEGELRQLAEYDRPALAAALEGCAAAVRLNTRLATAIEEADLIVYAPGTQHSSLFPSYLTPGLSAAVARNLTAIKLLVTNIQTDAEITGSSAVDIIDRAVFYLKEKGRLSIATPCLITHSLVNDPHETSSEAPYVPLGRLDSLEDPRMVRVANYEEGMSGRHDATKVLGPFVASFLARSSTTQRVAVLLYDASSTNKVVQSVLEMMRGGIREIAVTLAVFHDGPAEVDASFASQCGFPIRRLDGDAPARDASFRALLRDERFDYVVLFESSGMYNGEDVVSLASHLSRGRLDAVWGSRRLSVRDIQASYRLRYRHRTVLGAVSYVGSHLLSLLYLGL